jgi:hypothetical protein
MAERIKAGVAHVREFTLVNRAIGAPIDTGTVNYFLKALTGPNAGKWWNEGSDSWVASAQANAMTHEGAGHWSLTIDADAFSAGETLLEYASESSDVHVPVGRGLYVVTADVDDLPAAVWDRVVLASQGAGTFGEELHLAKAMLSNERVHTVSTGVDVVLDNDGMTTLRTMTPEDDGDDAVRVVPS